MNNAPLMLAIETATRAGSIAVARGEEILSSRAGDPIVSHSTNLIEMIDAALRGAQTTLDGVEMFAAAVGPGSFTGLRIGLATVKGFAVCNHRDVVGVSTLAAIAHASGRSGNVVSLLPAGRGEVFAQLLVVHNGTVSEKDEAAHLSPSSVLEKYEAMPGLIWTGEGAYQQATALEKFARERQIGFGAESENTWSIIQSAKILAESVAALGYQYFREGKQLRPAELHAVYVRPSDAEINERWQQQNAKLQVRS